MVLKALNDNVGVGTSSTLIAAVDWAVRARKAGVNLRVLNCSCGVTGGGSGGGSAVRDAIEQAGKAGILFASAAGNNGWDADRGDKYSTPCAIRQSLSRPGQCWDNAVAESFFSTLKNELVHQHAWPTRARARQAIFEFVEVYYNRRRLHSTLGYRSPATYEADRSTNTAPKEAAA